MRVHIPIARTVAQHDGWLETVRWRARPVHRIEAGVRSPRFPRSTSQARISGQRVVQAQRTAVGTSLLGAVLHRAAMPPTVPTVFDGL